MELFDVCVFWAQFTLIFKCKMTSLLIVYLQLLFFTEAVADIVGAPDLHIDEGSTLRLECKLKRATENPAYVFW